MTGDFDLSPEQMAQLILARSQNIGPVTFAQLLQRFGSAQQALAALPNVKGRTGKSPKLALHAIIEAEIASVRRAGARYLFMSEPDYPPLLRHLANAPPILIVKGDISLLTRPSIGIVGARNSSAGAKKFAHKLGFEIAEQGLTVVSGLARGIDSEAHKGAVAAAHRDRSNSAATIGVIASGIDIAYPPENAELQEHLATNALVVTEYPPGSEPVARHFPFRNRIIAGLSLATLVVEAAPRSGSLITARLANELGRQVLAIPGSPLDSRSAGCNGLIREGATLVRDVSDIVEAITPLLEGDALPVAPMFQQDEELCFDEPQAQEVKLMGETSIIASEERRDHIRNQLSQVAISPDELSILADCPIETVNAILVELEILGECERVAGGKIRAASS